MFEKAVMLFLYAETPVHAGTGTSLSIVDLPIQRERITDLPIIQASSLKGVLRAEIQDILKHQLNNPEEAEKKVEILFGPETQRASEHAGCLSFHDARLLLFPVRSLSGIFAWTTCPFVLKRFKRDLTAAGMESAANWDVPTLPSNSQQALVTSDSELVVSEKVVLEEFAFDAQSDDNVAQIANWLKEHAFPRSKEYEYWQDSLPKKFVILPDDAFRDFTKLSTEVIARIRLDQVTKTVERGALWTEEHLPSETLLYAPIFISKPLGDPQKVPDEFKENNSPSAQKVLEWFLQLKGLERVQIGGDETVGRGLAHIRLWAPTDSSKQGGESQ